VARFCSLLTVHISISSCKAFLFPLTYPTLGSEHAEEAKGEGEKEKGKEKEEATEHGEEATEDKEHAEGQ